MKLSTFLSRGMLLLVSVCVLTKSGSSQSSALIQQNIDDARVTLAGNVHPLAQARFDEGLAADSLAMKHMLLVLKRDDATNAALRTEIEALHAPKSSRYHQWLTPEQYRQSFGASDKDVQILSAWLAGQGFSVDSLSAGGTVLEFSGTAGQVRNAFRTSIHRYKVNGVEHLANSTDPQVPAALAPAIAGIVSLHNFERQPQHRDMGTVRFEKKSGTWSKLPEGGVPAGSGPGVKSLFTTAGPNGNTFYAVGPADFATIYNVKPLWDAGVDGTGQTIAIVGRSAIDKGDVDKFRAAFGLPPTRLNTILAGDMPGYTSSESEALLDIQWSGAVAKMATIDYVVAASTSTTDGIDLASLYAVDHNVAPVLSVSYGQCELGLGTAGNAFYNELWQQAVVEGITVMVASGDGSAAQCDQGNSVASYGLTVNGLASTPYNVGIGGTDFNDFGGANGVTHSQYWSGTNDPLTRGSALSYIPEMVWNDSCANNQVYTKFGFPDAETFCNSDPAVIAGLVNTFGTGGGISACTVAQNGDPSTCAGGYDKPVWQNTAGVPDDGKRDLPDVSLFAADGIAGSFYVYCNAKATPSGTCNYDDPNDIIYMAGGGTSFASPAFAGMMALVNQKTAQRQGNANYVLYSMARSQFGTMSAPLTGRLAACSADQGNAVDGTCIFQDVAAGDNRVPCFGGSANCVVSLASDRYGVTSGFDAAKGFDPATGLGSVNATNMVNGWLQAAVFVPTTTTLTLTPVTGTYGTTVAYTVTVAPTSGSGTPSGTGILSANNRTVGTFTLSGGKASGTVTGLEAGSYAVTASYFSDGVYANSTSAGVTVTFNKAATSTSLVLTEVNPFTGASTTTDSIHYGTKMVATATVTGLPNLAIPTGTVHFTSTGTDSQTQQLDSNGSAAMTTSLPVGSEETLTAGYSGDANYAVSTSSARTLSIVKATTAVRLAASTPYQVGAGSVTVTATAYSYSQGDKLSGNLTLSINGVAVQTVASTGSVDPVTGGAASTAVFTVPSTALSAGANKLTVAYAGDSNYEAATSPALTIGFSAKAPTSAVALTASTTTVAAQQTVVLSAAVTLGGLPATAGKVIFFDGAKTIGTSQIIRTSSGSGTTVGTATLSTRLGLGTHSISATFSGFGAIGAATTSSPLALTVTGVQPSSIKLTAHPNAVHSTNYDFIAAVGGSGYAPPAGTVSIEETSTVATLASAVPDPASASLTYNTVKTFNQNDVVEFLVTGDLNNDGIPDVILRRLGSVQNYLEVYLGRADGTYQAPVEYPVGKASRGHQIVIADFNGDGAQDVATVNQADSTISVLLGNGDGTLQPAYSVATQSNALNLLAADLNGDGIVDLLSFSLGNHSLAFSQGNGDGTFQAPVSSTLDLLSQLPAFADINHDGKIDVVYTGLIDFPKQLHVALGNGDGTFTGTSQTFPMPSTETPAAIHLADMDGDGNPDAVVAGNYSGNVTVMKGDGKGNFAAGVVTVGGINQPFISDALPVDLNGDGKLDIATLDSVGATVNILINRGDGTFAPPTGIFPTLPYASELYTADVNGDGVPDLLQTSQLNGDLQAVLLIGQTTETVKFFDVVTRGAAGQVQQGIATFAGDTTYSASSSNGVTFLGSGVLATPTIVWIPSTTTWGNGVPLGTGILDATTKGNLSGTYTYTAQLQGGQAVTVLPTTSLKTNGTYVLTVTFTPADTTSYKPASATQTLVISDPDFALSPGTAGSLVVQNGTSATTSITMNPLYGFGGFVNLACASPASGISCTVAPASVAPGSSATVTVTAAAPVVAAHARVSPAASVGYLAGGGAAVSFLMLFLMPHRRRKQATLGIAVLLLSAFWLSGCSSTSPQASTLALTTSNADIASGSSLTLTAATNSTQAGAR